MANDLIRRADAIDALSYGKEMLNLALDDMDVVGAEREKYLWGLGLIESTIKDIEQLPSAEPEIVRCKDCRYYKIDHPNTNGYHCCYRNHNIFPMQEDDFCSRAERRTDE